MIDLNPNPYIDHPTGPWHKNHFSEVVFGIQCLLDRYKGGEVKEATLLRGKDTGSQKRDTLSYWLYFQHHPGSERWKLLGQRYWSVRAWNTWKHKFMSFPLDQRMNLRDGLPHERTFPKRSTDGMDGLVSEHVVPKKVLKGMLLAESEKIGSILALNLCAVLTIEEDRNLPKDSHPDPWDPWVRYLESGIQFLPNPAWSQDERKALQTHGLIADV